MGWQHICLHDRLTDQTTTHPNKRRMRRIRTWAEHSRLQARPPLLGTLDHQNIPASDTKLTRSLGIYSIGPPVVMEKHIPVNSREITSPPEMGPLLDVECKPAVIIKPRFIIVTHTDHLSRTKRSTSRDKCTFNLSTGLLALQILHQGITPIASQTAV